jgi:hypothetical protein
MRILPVILLIGLTVSLGIYMGLRYLRGEKNKPEVIGFHFLIGIGGLEVLMVLMAGGLDGLAFGHMPLAQIAAALIASALVIAVITALGRPKARATKNLALAAHAGTALLGFGALLIWAASA